jgi:hypothetical protein
VRFIRVGTLDEPRRLPPDVHIFTSTKLPWIKLPADARVFAEYYKAPAVWSQASLARRSMLSLRSRQDQQQQQQQ